jgi:hypothetical protein
MILHFPTGRVDGLLLATGRDRLRLAIPQFDDTVELHFEEGRWIADTGAAVQIESMLCDSTTAIPEATMTAGSPRFH